LPVSHDAAGAQPGNDRCLETPGEHLDDQLRPSEYGGAAARETVVFANDRELLLSFRAGRREALERVYRAYVRSVDRALRAMARRSGHADLAQPSAIADLLQEIFVRAFSPAARSAYDGVRDFGPYLMTITRNCFFDLLRAAGRELPTRPEDLMTAADADAAEPDAGCDPKVHAVLAAYVRDLPAPLEQVYRQRFVLGQSQIEASASLGLSRRAIRTAEDRLRRGLRRALVQAGISLRELHEPVVDFPPRIPAAAVSHKGGV
jgi:RNA polymerase sigma-70 factor (ECF subfamily)